MTRETETGYVVSHNAEGLDRSLTAFKQHLATMIRYHPEFTGSVDLMVTLQSGKIESFQVGQNQHVDLDGLGKKDPPAARPDIQASW